MGLSGGCKYLPPEHQDDAALAQAAAVSTTWYTVLDTTMNCRIYKAQINMGTLAEDVELRITVDGIELVGAQAAAVAGAWYNACLSPTAVDALALFTARADGLEVPFILEGRSVKVEVRKTTANGANTLYGRVKYGKW